MVNTVVFSKVAYSVISDSTELCSLNMCSNMLTVFFPVLSRVLYTCMIVFVYTYKKLIDRISYVPSTDDTLNCLRSTLHNRTEYTPN